MSYDEFKKPSKKHMNEFEDLLKKKPEIGKKTDSTRVRLTEGTTCELAHKERTFKVDIEELFLLKEI